MNHSGVESSIAAVLTGLLASIDADNDSAYRELAESEAFKVARAKVEAWNPEEFYFVLSYPIGKAVDGLLNAVIPNNERVHFIFNHYDYVENHVKRTIGRFEGSAYSADKTAAVISRLLRFFIEGNPIFFDPSEKYTYHHPKKILKTHESIVDFFEAIHRLYYGDGDKFLEVTTRMKATNE